ncbi:protein-ER retention protein, partial [Blyttiomyces sp. JEL0837]
MKLPSILRLLLLLILSSYLLYKILPYPLHLLSHTISSLPLYFHVLLLANLGIWCWASNVHLLSRSGVDVNRLLEFDAGVVARERWVGEEGGSGFGWWRGFVEYGMKVLGKSGRGSVVVVGSGTDVGESNVSVGSGLLPAINLPMTLATSPTGSPGQVHADVKGSSVSTIKPASTISQSTTAKTTTTSIFPFNLLKRKPATPSPRLNLKPQNLYLLALFTTVWTLFTCFVFYLVSKGLGYGEEVAEVVPGFAYLIVLGVVLVPANPEGFFGRERCWFQRSLYRVAFDTINSPAVPLCDVILADILTSYSRVVGDLQLVVTDLLSADPGRGHPPGPVDIDGVGEKQVRSGGMDLDGLEGVISTEGLSRRDSGGGERRWRFRRNVHAHGSVGGVVLLDLVGPVLVSLPFLFRLRQCMTEYFQTRNPAAKTRHLLNAIKYTSALPVIISSWLINWLRARYELLDSDEVEPQSAKFTVDVVLGV